jgi:hypothetical protein
LGWAGGEAGVLRLETHALKKLVVASRVKDHGVVGLPGNPYRDGLLGANLPHDRCQQKNPYHNAKISAHNTPP